MIIVLKRGTIRCSFQTRKKKDILHVSGDISLHIWLGNGIRVREWGGNGGVTGSHTGSSWVALETPHLRLAVGTVGANIWAPLGEDTRVLVRVRT